MVLFWPFTSMDPGANSTQTPVDNVDMVFSLYLIVGFFLKNNYLGIIRFEALYGGV